MRNSPRFQALLAVLAFFGLAALYVREFRIFSNTIEIKPLLLGSVLVALVLAGGALWRWRDRFTPVDRHLPEALLILVFSAVFAPLFGSLLNRGLGSEAYQSFDFVSETAYYASGYGILKGEKVKPNGWRLLVREGGKLRRFSSKKQAYYPLTQQGEKVSLPICHGLFGVRVMTLP